MRKFSDPKWKEKKIRELLDPEMKFSESTRRVRALIRVLLRVSIRVVGMSFGIQKILKWRESKKGVMTLTSMCHVPQKAFLE